MPPADEISWRLPIPWSLVWLWIRIGLVCAAIGLAMLGWLYWSYPTGDEPWDLYIRIIVYVSFSFSWPAIILTFLFPGRIVVREDTITFLIGTRHLKADNIQAVRIEPTQTGPARLHVTYREPTGNTRDRNCPIAKHVDLDTLGQMVDRMNKRAEAVRSMRNEEALTDSSVTQ